MTLRDDYVKALEAENDGLRSKLAELEETLGIRIEAPILLGLSRMESQMFGALLKRDMLTKQQMMDVFYGAKPEVDEPEIKIVDVYVCKLRKKLKPFELEIETIWGQGYRMPSPSKVLAMAMIDQARAAA